MCLQVTGWWNSLLLGLMGRNIHRFEYVCKPVYSYSSLSHFHCYDVVSLYLPLLLWNNLDLVEPLHWINETIHVMKISQCVKLPHGDLSVLLLASTLLKFRRLARKGVELKIFLEERWGRVWRPPIDLQPEATGRTHCLDSIQPNKAHKKKEIKIHEIIIILVHLVQFTLICRSPPPLSVDHHSWDYHHTCTSSTIHPYL